MVLLDGAPQYDAFARAKGISYKVLIGGRRTSNTPMAYHLNTVNNLYAEWKGDFRRRWRRPASKYLDGYARWMVAGRSTEPLALFRAIIEAAQI